MEGFSFFQDAFGEMYPLVVIGVIVERIPQECRTELHRKVRYCSNNKIGRKGRGEMEDSLGVIKEQRRSGLSSSKQLHGPMCRFVCVCDSACVCMCALVGKYQHDTMGFQPQYARSQVSSD